MLVGYIRLSLLEPHAAAQLETLRQAGCEKVFIDERNDDRWEQPGLAKAWALMQPRDTLIVCRLERLGGSFKQVVQHIEELQRRRIGLRSVQEQIDTSGPDGPAQLRVFAAVVACDRTLLSERTRTGLRFARARGRAGGSKRRVTPAMVQQAAQLMQNRDLSVHYICQLLAISRATLYRYVSPTGEVRKE